MLATPAVTAGVLLMPESAADSALGGSRVTTALERLSPSPLGWTGDESLSAGEGWGGLDFLLPSIVFGWLAGVTVLLGRMGGGLWHVRRLQRQALAAAPSPWQRATERIARRLRLRAPVHVIESQLVDTPIACGWLRPVILLPVAALASLSPSQVEAILAHELIHIRRHDYLVNIAQTVAETLLFFHPGVWWVSAQVRAEREHSCDDAAVQVCGDPIDYAAALAELESWRSKGTALALAASQGPLIGRVRRLLAMPVGHEARSLSWVLTLTLTSLLVVVAGSVYVSSIGSRTAVPAPPAARAQGIDPIASPDAFDWQARRTDHFDIHYYPALTAQLEQIADAAERAYQRINQTLQYNLPFRVPLVVFKTRSDFEQQEIIPGLGETIASGDVTAFSEPKHNRIVLLVDEDPERLYRLITHELTHIFAFDIVPRSATNRGRVPPWIDEGFADYMTGVWDPARLRELREMVAGDGVPRVSTLTGKVEDRSWAATTSLGHSAFEFIEAEYGQAGVWQFLLETRRKVVDGTGDPYHTAFGRTAEEFDSAFSEYLRRRFSL